MLHPLLQRSTHAETNTTYGLSIAGYDVRLDQDVVIYPGFTTLASTLEKWDMERDVVAIPHDKSTWARRGLQVQNTVVEPGWMGFLTLELTYNPVILPEHTAWEVFKMRQKLAWGIFPPLRIPAGAAIAQVLFNEVDKVTKGYDGHYQNQARGPQKAK